MISAPVFACAESMVASVTLIRISIALYILGAILTSFSSSYSFLLAARAVVGIGQGGYASFITTIIDSIAPLQSRTMFLGAYFGMIVIGPAIGIVVGGSTGGTSLELHDPLDSTKFTHEAAVAEIEGAFLPSDENPFAPWRIPFLLEAMAMLPVFFFMLLYSERRQKKYLRRRQSYIDSMDKESSDIIAHSVSPKRKAALEDLNKVKEFDLNAEENGKDVPRMKDSILHLLRCKQFLLTTIGYCGLTFVFGALSVYVLPFLSSHPVFPLSASTASMYVGCITVLTGILGTAFGGFILDRVLGGSEGKHGLARCHLLNSICVLLAFPCGFCAFFVSKTYQGFFFFLAIAEFFVFMANAPINAATLSSAPAMNVRTLAVSLSIFFIHCFGDFPSPIVVGGLIDKMTYKHSVCQPYTHSPTAAEANPVFGDALNLKQHCESHTGLTYQCRWLPANLPVGRNSTMGRDPWNPSVPHHRAEMQYFRENYGQCVNVYSIRNSLIFVIGLWLLSICFWMAAFVLVTKDIKRQCARAHQEDTLLIEPTKLP